MNKHYLFFKRFLKNPQGLGAVAPSSRSLSKAMVAGLDLDQAKVVVEYGPGLGAFTREILGRINSHTRYIGIEKDPAFARILAEEHPEAEIVTGDARDADKILARLGVEQVDVVISGLPFANFSSEMQQNILGQTFKILKPGGAFVTFSYIHAWPLNKARRFRNTVAAIFSQVHWNSVMRNVPPAFVVECRKNWVAASSEKPVIFPTPSRLRGQSNPTHPVNR